ncbi:MAG: cysteine peptidase family C39 domain-containing protein [Planctomycetota bacterium]|jgi:hypothetical protein
MKLRFLNPLEFADIWIALAVMIIISILFFLFSCRIARRLSKTSVFIFAAVTTLCIVLFAKFLLDSRWILVLLPFQASVIYGNFLGPLSAILIGIIWQDKKIPRWRRILVMVTIAALAFRLSFRILTVEPPNCLNVWAGSVCLQTSQSSCSAASAATLLQHYRIKSSEEEMTRLCLTSDWGTCLHGLYRGLRIKTDDEPFQVKVKSADLNQMQKDVLLPAILNVRLDKEVAERDPRYSNDWGWRVGVTHTVVIFGFNPDGLIDMGDPGTGREFWDMQALRDLWHGEYIILESY